MTKNFSQALALLADRLVEVLTHEDDWLDLEHHAVLFWPKMNTLHTFLGADLRGDELIAACDIFRAQFRLCPVPADALRVLENAMREASVADVLDTASVAKWIAKLHVTSGDVWISTATL